MRRLYLVVMSALLLLILLAAISIGTTYSASTGNSVYPRKGASSMYYTCGGTCENKDPYRTDCSQGAYRANYQANAFVRVEDWYSPKCGAN